MIPKLLILDMDMTLVLPIDKAFYNQYGLKTLEAIGEYFGLPDHEALQVAQRYRRDHGGAEHALFRGDDKPADYALLHRKLSEIDPTGSFNDHSHLRAPISDLRRSGTKVVVLTSSPSDLAGRIMDASGFTPETDFDAVYAYTEDQGPTKIIHGAKAFADVMQDFGIAAKDTLSIGDTIKHDIDPALSLGADAIVISDQPNDGYKTSPNLETVLKRLKRRP